MDAPNSTVLAQQGAIGPAGGGVANGGVLNGGAAAGGGQANFDFGPTLVDVIERTIRPEHWESAGGPAAIVYYQPLRALVISATQQAHEEVAQLLHDLRAASGP